MSNDIGLEGNTKEASTKEPAKLDLYQVEGENSPILEELPAMLAGIPRKTPKGEWVFQISPQTVFKYHPQGAEPRYHLIKARPIDDLQQIKSFIYEMYDEKLGRKVAAKLTFLQRNTLEEARKLAKFEHPNIARIYDLAMKNDNPDIYFITEWVEGGNLDQWIEQDHTLSEISAVINQTASGLDHINNKGYVYGDMKPRNVMLDDSGRAKIIDLELSVPMDANGFGEHTPGTFGYAAPEQEKEDAPVTRQTDVYSFAALVFSILDKETYTTMKIDLEKFLETQTSLIPLAKGYQKQITSKQHQELSTVLRRALATNPGDRYPTVAKFNEELQRYL